MSTTDWHADAAMLSDYLAGALGTAHAGSIEAHLMACAECRAALASLVDGSWLERSWAGIAGRLDGRTATERAVRVLRRIGIAEHRARLVVLTPTLRNPTFAAVVGVLAAFSVLNATDGGGEATLFLFLVFAPLLPIVGVAAAFGSFGDPGRELVATTPTTAFELALIRTVAVVVVTTLVTAMASLALPLGWESAAWLLPSLGLTAMALAVATWVSVHVAAASIGGTWLLAAVASWRINRFDPDVLSRFVALRPAGQAMFAALTVAGAVVLVLRREALDLRRFA